MLLERDVDELGEIDLTRTVVVTPGARAGRQLLLALDDGATAMGVGLVPPRIVTPSGLLAALVPTLERRACDAETWIAAVADILARGGPAVVQILAGDADGIERRATARALVAADRRLRAGEVDWEVAATEAEALGGDSDRYRAIGTILADAGDRVNRLGLAAPEEAAAARLRMLVDRDGAVSDRDFDEIVLFGVVDPTKRDRRVVEAAVDAGLDVTVLAMVEETRLQTIDRWGALRVERWLDAPPVVPLESIRVESGPLDEAIGVVEHLAELTGGDGELDPDGIGLVLADETNAGVLRREIEAAGVSVHLATGRPLAATGIARSLSVLATWLERGDTEAFGAILVDPILGRLACGEGEGARVAEEVAAKAWSTWTSSHVPRPAVGGCFGEDASELESALATFRAACIEVDVGPLGSIVAGIVDVLAQGLEASSIRSDREFDVFADAVAPLIGVPETLQPSATPVEGCAVLLEVVSRASVPDPHEADALETIGWLEAPFDPAERVVVVGVHDGAVPGTAEDPLLPNTLRTALGIDDENSRRARDLWVVESILGKDPHAIFLVPRRDLSGEPLVPSRLLFGDRGGALAHRVRRLFEPPVSRRPAAAETGVFGRCRPPAAGVERVPRRTRPMSVTEFRTYLQSPYRYWVERVLGLRGNEPVGREFDPRMFGNLLHDAVESFGKAERLRQGRGEPPTIDPSVIEEEMVEALRTAATPLVSEDPGAGIRLQMRILEKRLGAVAAAQANHTLAGWRIHDVEAQIDAVLDVQGDEGQSVTGRIDRIDRHDEHGWMVIDFKSSDKGKGPDPSHHQESTGRWIDLQLPLYRWAASRMLPDAPSVEEIHSAYFLAPADPGQVGVKLAKKIDKKYEEAIDTAQEVVRSIRSGYFDDLGIRAPHGDDPLAIFMRTHALGDVGEDED